MITSSANQKVKQVVQWQTKAKERRNAGVFLTEGFKMFEEAPEAAIREVYVSREALERAGSQQILKEKLDRVGFETVSDELFVKMSDTQTPQGILCVLEQPRYELEQLLDVPKPLLIVLENLQDPGNLGTIVRTGEGAGITGVIMSHRTVDIFNPKVIRATMGSIFRVPFLYVDNLEEAILKCMKEESTLMLLILQGKNIMIAFRFGKGQLS